MNPIIILVGALLLLIVLKVPIAFSLGISGVLYLLIFPGDVTSAALLDKMYMGIYNYTFLAVPFFILAGAMMNTGGISERIFNFALSLVGHIKGGLGHVNIIASIIFSGMSGSAVADTAGLGKIEIEAMKKEGYTPEFSACITAASATIGPIIPPSGTMVIYGVLSGASIGRLFLGGVLPGLLMGFALMVLVYYQAKKDPEHFRAYPKPTVKKVWESYKRAFLPLWTPVIILGGIIIGFVTPTEAGVLAVLYALLLGIYYKEFRFKDFQSILVETSLQVGAVMLILAGARVLSYVMTLQRVPALLSVWMLSFTDNPMVVLFLINIVILVLGMFLNSSTILVLTVPILQPILQRYGIDLVHFGVVLTLNVMIGMLTPPLGVCLYIAADIAEVKFEKIIKHIIPFYIPLIVVLFLITYIPGLVLWLPNLLMK
jgi:tripartite ATP-independent transporter DctM subunit